MATRNYGTGTTAKTILLAPTNPQDNAKTGLAFVKRKLGVNNRLVLPLGGSQPPNLYVPFRLGAYTKPLDAVADLVKMGFKYVKGIHNVDPLLPPDKISTNLSTGVTTLVWVGAAIGLEQYAEASKVVGTIVQNTTDVDKPTASLMSISVKDGVSTLSCVLVNGSPIFNTTDAITLDVTIETAVPNPYLSDNAVYTAYKFYSQYSVSPQSTTSPELWLSVIPESNGDINANDVPINLGIPSRVYDLGNGDYNLIYPVTSNNLGLLPTSYLGNSIVSQGSAIATYQGYRIIGNECVISISNASGSFMPPVLFCAVGNAGTISTSTNGTTWTLQTNSVPNDLYGIAVNASGLFCAVGTVGTILTSTNGTTWTSQSSGVTSNIRGVAVNASGLFCAVGTVGTILTSTNGTTWTLQTSGVTVPLVGIAVNASGLFCAVGAGGTILTSTNGTTWTSQSSGVTSNIRGVAVNASGLFCAVGDAGTILTSTNGTTWTLQTNSVPNDLYGIAVNASGLFCAVGTVGTILTSTNGTTWTSQSSGVTSNIRGVAVNASGLFCAVNDAGTILTSTNGTTWTLQTSGVTVPLVGIAVNASAEGEEIPDPTFSASKDVIVTLDPSQSGFDYLGNEEISSYLLGYAEVHNTTELKNNYPVFDANIVALQSPEATKSRKYEVKGYYGYAFKSIGEYKTIVLTCPDTTMYKASLTFDVNTKYQEPTLGYGIAALSMFMDLDSNYPYYEASGTGALINTPASTNKASWVKQDVINLATSQGWTVFVPNESGLHYVYRNVCTLQTVSSREDAEYRYMSFQLKLRYYVKNSVEIAETTCTNSDGTRKNNNPGLITQLKTNLESLQSTLQNKAQIAGFESILGANCSVSVVLNPSDVTRTLIQEKISIVSGNGGNDIEIYVEPYTI